MAAKKLIVFKQVKSSTKVINELNSLVIKPLIYPRRQLNCYDLFS